MKEQSLKISVRDTGRGIPKEKIETLFDAYSQVSSSDTRKYGGTGLGLMISNKIVNSYGNSIQVESTVGEGSCFSFELPYLEAKMEEGLEVGKVSLSEKNILLLESNKTNRLATEQMLRALSVKFDSYISAEKALLALRMSAIQADAVILDYQVSDLPLKDIIDELNLRKIPTVVVTSMPARGDGAKMVELGVKAYLTKPIKQSLLEKTLMALISHDDKVKEEPLITQYTFGETREHKEKILLVDDNPINQNLAIRTLDKMGYRCDVADNGKEALDAVDSHEYDLVLMDCQMPVMNGFEATREIRKREGDSKKHLKIYAMTASNLKEDQEACYEAGMDGFFSKPFDKAKMEKSLHKIFRSLT